jgi:hypothetical protein
MDVMYDDLVDGEICIEKNISFDRIGRSSAENKSTPRKNRSEKTMNQSKSFFDRIIEVYIKNFLIFYSSYD